MSTNYPSSSTAGPGLASSNTGGVDPVALLAQHAKGTDTTSAGGVGWSKGQHDLGGGGLGQAVNDAPLSLHVAGNILALKPGLSYSIGSSPQAHVHLGPGSGGMVQHIAPEAAVIAQNTLRVLSSPQMSLQGVSSASFAPVILNGREVPAGVVAPLREGDHIRIAHHDIHIRQGDMALSGGGRHEASTAIPSGSGATLGALGAAQGMRSAHDGSMMPQKDPAALSSSQGLGKSAPYEQHIADKSLHPTAGGPARLSVHHQGHPEMLQQQGVVHGTGPSTATSSASTSIIPPHQQHVQQHQQGVVDERHHDGIARTMINDVKRTLGMSTAATGAGAVAGAGTGAAVAHHQQQHQKPIEQHVESHQHPTHNALSHQRVIDQPQQPVQVIDHTNRSGLSSTDATRMNETIMADAVPTNARGGSNMAAPLGAAAAGTAATLEQHPDWQQQQSGLQQPSGLQQSSLQQQPSMLHQSGLHETGVQQHPSVAVPIDSSMAAMERPSSLGSSTGVPASNATSSSHAGGVDALSSQPHLQGQSASSSTLPQHDGSFVLAPSFSSAELGNVLGDMVDLSGLRLSEGARGNIPHWLSLFPAQQRQHLGSADMKEWAKLAIAERTARMAMGADAGAGSASSGSALGSNASTGSSTVSPASAMAAAKALMGGSLGSGSSENELLESDFIFAMLAMQARREREREHGLGGDQGLGSGGNYQMGVARLAGPRSVPDDVNASSSSTSAAGPSNDFALMNLMSDLAEMGQWRLGAGWEAAVRYMLDESHMAPGRRREFATSTRIKNWLREAARDRQRMQGRSSGGAAAGINGGQLSVLNLAHALIASQHAQQL